jgi:hypothetical protein
MKLISHRGNLNGINRPAENHPKQIQMVLGLDFDCEIDVWYKNNQYFLGHDMPEHKIEEEFLENPSLWCHAKNIEALCKMQENRHIHCFWHENDAVTLTSKGIIWAFPREIAIPHSIAVLPEKFQTNIENCFGVCSDVIINYS